MKTTLTDRNNQILGFVETAGTRSTLTDRNNQILGFYDSGTNWTTNRDNQPIGQGNLLAVLLPAKQ
jgi:hypothetical protein